MNSSPPSARLARLSDLGLRDLWAIAGRLWIRVNEDRIMLIAAGIAFYGLLALFPALTALVAFSGLVIDPATIADHVVPMVRLLPAEAGTIILDQISEVSATQSETLGLGALIALAIALFSASRGTGNLIAGLNVVYEERETRGLIRLTLLNIVLTVFIVLMMVAQLAIVAVAPAVMAWIVEAAFWEEVVAVLRWPLLFAFALATLAVVFRFGPCRRKARWRWIAPGTLFACLMWIAGTFGFALYVANFATYNETFGALGGVVILLMWLWLTALSALFGGLIDAEIEAQMARDTTIGRPQPPGHRGAVKANQVAGQTP